MTFIFTILFIPVFLFTNFSLAKPQQDLRIVYDLQQRTVRVHLYTTRINGNGFDLRQRPGVPTTQSITHLQPEPD